MAIFRDTPYTGMNFSVDIGTGDPESADGAIFEVVFPESQIQVIEYRDGNDKANDIRKILAGTRYENLCLIRGVRGSLTWYNWWNSARNGDQSAVRTIAVKLLNEDRTAVVLEWKFLGARPVNHQFSRLSAICEENFSESLEIAFERLEMQ
ncbi:MAG: phage tail protein [Pyrinomonadaceae bacterium]